jgi:hypothetical protein
MQFYVLGNNGLNGFWLLFQSFGSGQGLLCSYREKLVGQGLPLFLELSSLRVFVPRISDRQGSDL